MLLHSGSTAGELAKSLVVCCSDAGGGKPTGLVCGPEKIHTDLRKTRTLQIYFNKRCPTRVTRQMTHAYRRIATRENGDDKCPQTF
ncbi:hypothetical protein F2P81_008385 [Scophthalmus maximus]|uniref:Uncharacterized protein n=1 Tax=Scophthalmus maximus TaxID=52904 RepID=A0A6A4T844_SCOMX|nr:hypothetical protein F2P81_008385 [Scophthalmus maximus]